MTKAVIFDFGDTLVDYPLRDNPGQLAYIVNFIEQMVANNVVSLERFEDATHFAKTLNTENSDQSTWPFLERVRSERFFGPALSFEAAYHLEHAICEGVFKDAQLLPDALPVVEELKMRGLRTGIVSNLPWGTSSRIWNNEFARHGFGSEVIDHVVCCVDAGFRKPHPAAIIECLRRLNCEPSHALYVGDRPSDVQAGKAAGCRTALVARRTDSHTDEADMIVHDLRDLLKQI